MNIYNHYMKDWDIRPEFKKEYVSIFEGWLGKENLHKLDEVSEKEWSKFNHFIKILAENFELFIVNCENQTAIKVDDVNTILSSYKQSMNKDSSQFLKIIIPELKFVVSEEWDYTYILWYKENTVIDVMKPLLSEAGLYHFNDAS